MKTNIKFLLLIFLIPIKLFSQINIVDDLTPQLGGNLDGNGKEIINSKHVRANEDISGGLKLTLGTSSNHRYDLTYRDIGMVIPTFRPNGINKVIALDLMPNGTPSENGTNGFSWLDICDADIKTTQIAVNCARVGIRSSFVEFGSRSYNGGILKDIALTINSESAILIKTNYAIVFSKYINGLYNVTYLNKTATNLSFRLATDGTILTEREAINKISLTISDTGAILLNNSNYTGSLSCIYTTVYTINGLTVPTNANIICTVNSSNWNHVISANIVNNKVIVYIGDIVTNELTTDNFSIKIEW